jgi:hypothetical protein
LMLAGCVELSAVSCELGWRGGSAIL